jgi:hypothetical protein
MKRFSLTLAAILLSFPLLSGFVRAAEPTTTIEASTDFQNRLSALVAVFKLTESEIADLQLRLQGLERPIDPEFALVYDTLEENLEEYLDLTQSRIEELSSGYITLSGVLTTAGNLNNWRKTVYDPGTRELFDFLLLQQGGMILSIVETRYEKVATDVENLKLSVAPEKAEAFQLMLADARTRVENAKLLRDEARAMFLASFRTRHSELDAKFARLKTKNEPAVTSSVSAMASVIEGVLSSEPVVEVKPKTILDTIDMSQESVQTLMQRVVDEISAAYQVFLQMRDLVHQK